VLPVLSGEQAVEDLDYAWRLLRSPLPTMDSTNEPNARRLFRNLREDLDLPPGEHLAGALSELPVDLREDLETELVGRVPEQAGQRGDVEPIARREGWSGRVGHVRRVRDCSVGRVPIG
jgi:hypothetical protein